MVAKPPDDFVSIEPRGVPALPAPGAQHFPLSQPIQRFEDTGGRAMHFVPGRPGGRHEIDALSVFHCR